MKIDVDEPMGANDDFHAFAHTHVAFATFHPHYRFEDCHIELYLHAPGRAGCCLSAVSEELGSVEVNAVADDAYDVVARAAELLGEEIDQRIERVERKRERADRERERGDRERRHADRERQHVDGASGPAARLPLHSLAPAPRPASTSWADIG